MSIDLSFVGHARCALPPVFAKSSDILVSRAFATENPYGTVGYTESASRPTTSSVVDIEKLSFGPKERLSPHICGDMKAAISLPFAHSSLLLRRSEYNIMSDTAVARDTDAAACAQAVRDFSGGANENDTLLIESADGLAFRVNKASFSLLSSVFEHMFRDAKQDDEPLRLPENAATIDHLLRFMLQLQLGNVTLPAAISALRAADKYDMGLVRLAIEHHAMCARSLAIRQCIGRLMTHLRTGLGAGGAAWSK